MHHEFRSNGKIELELEPSTEIEIAFVKAFLSAAEKGQVVKVAPSNDVPLAMVLSLEK